MSSCACSRTPSWPLIVSTRFTASAIGDSSRSAHGTMRCRMVSTPEYPRALCSSLRYSCTHGSTPLGTLGSRARSVRPGCAGPVLQDVGRHVPRPQRRRDHRTVWPTAISRTHTHRQSPDTQTQAQSHAHAHPYARTLAYAHAHTHKHTRLHRTHSTASCATDPLAHDQDHTNRQSHAHTRASRHTHTRTCTLGRTGAPRNTLTCAQVRLHLLHGAR